MKKAMILLAVNAILAGSVLAADAPVGGKMERHGATQHDEKMAPGKMMGMGDHEKMMQMQARMQQMQKMMAEMKAEQDQGKRMQMMNENMQQMNETMGMMQSMMGQMMEQNSQENAPKE